MFDKYVHRANSLRLFRDALMEVGCEDALARLWQGWERKYYGVQSHFNVDLITNVLYLKLQVKFNEKVPQIESKYIWK